VADDTDDWLAALRGKHAAGADTGEVERLGALRATIRRANDSTDVRHDGPKELERLLFRLRREHLLDAAAQPPRRSRVPIAVAAVVVAGLAITLLWPAAIFERGEPEPPILRGGGTLQILEADDPRRAAGEVRARLEALAIGVETYEVGAHAGVSARVADDKAARAREVLEPLGVNLPASGDLRVEFRKRGALP
jgi:hypothetical protein